MPKALTTEIFIGKAIVVHGNKYNYSMVEYKGARNKIIIICKIHGEFVQLPASHVNGNGCKNCANDAMVSNRTKTNDEFIEKAIETHGDKYDYSKVEYINSRTNIIIICKIHGEFVQLPSRHLYGRGCKNCGIILTASKLTKSNDEFIQNAIDIHGDKYDYSKVEYINNCSNILIICKTHGEFEQRPSTHLSGHGCKHCAIDLNAFKWTKTNDEFIEKAIETHGDKYDYSKVEYINNNSKIIIICKLHGEFNQMPSSHLQASGCSKCGIDLIVLKKTKTNNEFIQNAIDVHGDKYDYSKVEYVNSSTKIIIICKKHGEFTQNPNGHLQANGCPKCACTGFSKAQIEWITFIEKLRGITIQHAMNDGEYKIKTTRWLADGYCKETNTVFEYHGDYWHGNLNKYDPEFINTVTNKKMKTLYASTLKREQKIRDLGYNLEVMWESDWKQINKSIRCIQLKYRALTR